MSWNAWQREVLAELGLQPMRLAPAPASARTDAAREAEPRLIAALARAARCTPEEVLALADPATLRNVADRRSLWPQLRRMRASR